MIQAFLQSLIETGQPILKIDDERPELWLSKALGQDTKLLAADLKSLHAIQQLDMPGSALKFHESAAIWGAKVIFALSAATVFREMEIQEIMGTVPKRLPQPDTPEAHDSADICLRYLPDIHALVAKIADGDPLLTLIEEIALSAPLSSAGMQLPHEPALETIIAHPGLSQLHAERVIKLSDQPRASIPDVAETIDSLVGSYRNIFSLTLIK